MQESFHRMKAARRKNTEYTKMEAEANIAAKQLALQENKLKRKCRRSKDDQHQKSSVSRDGDDIKVDTRIQDT